MKCSLLTFSGQNLRQSCEERVGSLHGYRLDRPLEMGFFGKERRRSEDQVCGFEMIVWGRMMSRKAGLAIVAGKV